MKPNKFPFTTTFKAALLLAAAALAGGNALASPATEAQAVLRAEMAVCKAGASPQGRDTCIYEAQSAYAENRRGTLADDGTDYRRNARLRCEVKTGCERDMCMSRVQDQAVAGAADRVVPADVCIVPAATRAPATPVVPVESKNPL